MLNPATTNRPKALSTVHIALLFVSIPLSMARTVMYVTARIESNTAKAGVPPRARLLRADLMVRSLTSRMSHAEKSGTISFETGGTAMAANLLRPTPPAGDLVGSTGRRGPSYRNRGSAKHQAPPRGLVGMCRLARHVYFMCI